MTVQTLDDIHELLQHRSRVRPSDVEHVGR